MTVLLKVDGKEFGGWKDVRITRGIERGCSDFSLTVSDKWPGQASKIEIKTGMACEVYDDADILITGYIDEVQVDADATTHSISFNGRSKVADLVDCSANNSPGQWTGQGLLKIATDIASPYGVKVKALTDLGAVFPDFKIQQGDGAFDAIERLCRMRGVLACDDTRGNLTFTRAGTSRAGTALLRRSGDDTSNILAGGARFSERDRFKTYIVKGQSIGSDLNFGDTAAGPTATAIDKAMGRPRTLVSIAQQATDIAGCATEAKWNRATRAGRSVAASYVVQGWREGGDKGALWTPNTLIAVNDDIANLQGDMLISEVSYSISDAGTLTGISLYPPEAFELMAESPKKKTGSVAGGYTLYDAD